MIPRVSVIIPTYNVGNYIQNCIRSVLKQTYQNLEVIIVDDGSSDDTLRKVGLFREKVQVFKQRHSGQSKARNTGISKASGEFITFMDADDEISPHHVEYLVQALKINCNELAFCKFTRTSLKSFKDEIPKIKIVDRNQAAKLILGSNDIMGFVWNKIYRTDILKQEKIYFNPEKKYMEDLLFNLKYMESVKSIGVVCQATYLYRVVMTGIVNNQRSFGSTFSSNWLTEIEIYKEVLSIVNRKYKNARTTFLSVMTWEFNVLRLLIRESDSFKENKNIYQNLTTFIKKNKLCVINSSEFSFKKKIILIILLYCPFIMDVFVKICASKNV